MTTENATFITESSNAGIGTHDGNTNLKRFSAFAEIVNPLAKNTQDVKDPDALEAGMSIATGVLGYFLEFKFKLLERLFHGIGKKVTVGGSK